MLSTAHCPLNTRVSEKHPHQPPASMGSGKWATGSKGQMLKIMETVGLPFSAPPSDPTMSAPRCGTPFATKGFHLPESCKWCFFRYIPDHRTENSHFAKLHAPALLSVKSVPVTTCRTVAYSLHFCFDRDPQNTGVRALGIQTARRSSRGSNRFQAGSSGHGAPGRPQAGRRGRL